MDVIPAGDHSLAHCVSGGGIFECNFGVLIYAMFPKVSFCDEKLVIVQRKTGL
jgi:hypothetical protein